MCSHGSLQSGGGSWSVTNHSIGEGEARTDGCGGGGSYNQHTVSTNARIPLTSTDRVISSAPSTDTTRPHHQSSHVVARGTGVGSRGANSSGDGGCWVVSDPSIGWYREVWTKHCNKIIVKCCIPTRDTKERGLETTAHALCKRTDIQ